MPMPVISKRARLLVEANERKGAVIYWMSREQRVNDNWALLFAQELAIKENSPLGVIFCLSPEFLGAKSYQYNFMLKGLKEVENDLTGLNIPFFLLYGDPGKKIPQFLQSHEAGALVSDFSPLRIKDQWQKSIALEVSVPFYEVDGHNIVPCWQASAKQEWAAYSIRPKIHRLLDEYLVNFPPMRDHPFPWPEIVDNDWQAANRSIWVDDTKDVNDPDFKWAEPGERAARRHLDDFIVGGLTRYDSDRNNPVLDGQSGLSFYLHFGQISAQRVSISALSSMTDSSSFLEELVVRRELADNFCYYNTQYDSVQGFPNWAKETLKQHERDPREYLYRIDELEKAKTHDDLWNAAQMEMVCRGKMHGYMRMYWAKKILEWTISPAEALKIAIYLNDRYELDGRDPNGYTGIAWSIGGVHDRAWKERAIFGKVRYMNYNGAKRKFNIRAYIEKVESIESE